MQHWLLGVALMSAGCDRVFMLDREDDPVDPCWNAQLQGNEDSDSYSDGCDPCPADVDAAVVVNGDGDELGDACDPRPAEAGQSWVTFDGLESSAGWTMTAGAWTFAGGALAHSNALSSGTIERMIDGTQHPGADVLIDGFGGGALTHAAGVLFDVGQFNVECSFEQRTNGNDDRFVLRVDNAMVDEVTNVIGGGALRIQLFQDAAGVFHCRGSRGTTQYPEISSTPLMATTSAKIILRATRTVASFKSVGVFSTN